MCQVVDCLIDSWKVKYHASYIVTNLRHQDDIKELVFGTWHSSQDSLSEFLVKQWPNNDFIEVWPTFLKL
jgi:hypothetical protein